ncbi:MAG: hypothetical protein ACQESC_02995 [Nanobdellota archaeon]
MVRSPLNDKHASTIKCSSRIRKLGNRDMALGILKDLSIYFSDFKKELDFNRDKYGGVELLIPETPQTNLKKPKLEITVVNYAVELDDYDSLIKEELGEIAYKVGFNQTNNSWIQSLFTKKNPLKQDLEGQKKGYLSFSKHNKIYYHNFTKDESELIKNLKNQLETGIKDDDAEIKSYVFDHIKSLHLRSFFTGLLGYNQNLLLETEQKKDQSLSTRRTKYLGRLLQTKSLTSEYKALHLDAITESVYGASLYR